ncbi:hypothetical protein F2Q69_00012929 [Brassica cretica]|uniref:Uncharacterized protein n=1 Tax=Brassica cretica TaxID=69181 RepID=A0A8S9QU03_BRACR|nr:hypothetical protein F2Q69_00012929 [Brassica cretica]
MRCVEILLKKTVPETLESLPLVFFLMHLVWFKIHDVLLHFLSRIGAIYSLCISPIQNRLVTLCLQSDLFRIVIVTARSPGVRPGLSKGRYGHVSTHLANPTCPVTGPERRAHNLL